MDRHPPSICVVFSGGGWRQRSMARTGGYCDRRQRQAVAVAAALAAAVATGGYSGGGRLWRRRKEQLQQSQVGVKIFAPEGWANRSIWTAQSFALLSQ